MSFKKDVEKELVELRAWAEEVNLQAHLAKSEIKAEVRTAWMEAEQHAAKLEAKLDGLGDTVDRAVSDVLAQLKESYQKVKSALDE